MKSLYNEPISHLSSQSNLYILHTVVYTQGL